MRVSSFAKCIKKSIMKTFKLLSFVVYDTIVGNENQHPDVNQLRKNNTNNLEFDYAFKRNDRDKKLNKNSYK